MVENKSLLRDCFASGYMTLRLIAAVILFAFLTAIAISAKEEYLLQISEQQVLGEIRRVEENAVLLYRSGGESNELSRGSLLVLSLRLPESMKYAVFGAGLFSGNSTDEEANLYHYELKNGKKQSFSSNAKFCAAAYKNGTPVPLIYKPVILHPGSYEVCLTLVRFENQSCIMIFERDLRAGR